MRTRSTDRRAKRADIQGLRAVAVLLVAAFHAGMPVPGGFVGVDIFFVVSGFVITAMLDREWQQTGRINLGSFYLRRFRRLTPALALMIATTLAISAVIESPLGHQQTVGQTAIGAMLLVANFVIARTSGHYFDAPAGTNPLLHTWSLSVEEQFYFIFPALLALGWILSRRRHAAAPSLYAVVACLAVLSFSLAVAGSLGIRMSHEHLMGFYSPLTRAWEFAAGALLALAPGRRTPQSRGLLWGLGLVGFGALLASVALINNRTPFPGVWTLLPVVGTLLLLWVGADSTAPTSRLLSSRPIVRIGDWSYSIYLWHWPFIVFAGLIWQPVPSVLVGAVIASFLPAVLSYEWVEQPIRNLSGLAPIRWAKVAVAVVLPPLLLGGVLWSSASQGWWSGAVRRLQSDAMPLHAGAVNGCAAREPLGSPKLVRCEWNRDAAGKPIYLLGDSNGDHFSEAFIRAAGELNRSVFIAAGADCPFVDLALRGIGPLVDDPSCERYVAGTLEYLSHAAGGLVVISNSDKYWAGGNGYEAGTDRDQLSSDPSRKISALELGLRRTIDALRRSGHQVMLVQTAPNWGDTTWDPRLCSLGAIMRGHCASQRTLESAVHASLAVRSVLAAVGRNSDVKVWDPAASLCPLGLCSTNAPAFTRYRDPTHISVPQSIALAPDITTAIAEIGGGRPQSP